MSAQSKASIKTAAASVSAASQRTELGGEKWLQELGPGEWGVGGLGWVLLGGSQTLHGEDHAGHRDVRVGFPFTDPGEGERKRDAWTWTECLG